LGCSTKVRKGGIIMSDWGWTTLVNPVKAKTHVEAKIEGKEENELIS